MNKKHILAKAILSIILILSSVAISSTVSSSVYAKAYNADLGKMTVFTGTVKQVSFELANGSSSTGYEIILDKPVKIKSALLGTTSEKSLQVNLYYSDQWTVLRNSVNKKISVVGKLTPGTTGYYFENYALLDSAIVKNSIVKSTKQTTHKDKSAQYMVNGNKTVKFKNKTMTVTGTMIIDSEKGPLYDLSVKSKKNNFIITPKTTYEWIEPETYVSHKISKKEFLKKYKDHTQLLLKVSNGKVKLAAAGQGLQF